VTVRAQAKGGAGGFVLAGGSAFAVLTSVFIAGGASFAVSAAGFFAGDASDGGPLSEVTGFSTAGSFAADGVCA
jgi:hypothetical protein